MRKYNLFLMLAATFILYSCGPVYHTNYIYTPPKSKSGIDCITDCNKTRTYCEERQLDDLDRCKDRADRDYENCEYHRKEVQNSCLKRHKYSSKEYRDCLRDMDVSSSCYKANCEMNLKVCEAPFNNCYRICGGIVTEEKVCVSGCEELNRQ